MGRHNVAAAASAATSATHGAAATSAATSTALRQLDNCGLYRWFGGVDMGVYTKSLIAEHACTARTVEGRPTGEAAAIEGHTSIGAAALAERPTLG